MGIVGRCIGIYEWGKRMWFMSIVLVRLVFINFYYITGEIVVYRFSDRIDSILYYLILYYIILSYIILSYLILYYLILSYLIII